MLWVRSAVVVLLSVPVLLRYLGISLFKLRFHRLLLASPTRSACESFFVMGYEDIVHYAHIKVNIKMFILHFYFLFIVINPTNRRENIARIANHFEKKGEFW